MSSDRVSDRVHRVRRMLERANGDRTLESVANSTSSARAEPLDPSVVKSVAKRAECELNRIVTEYLDSGRREQELVKRIVSDAASALHLVGRDEDEFQRKPELLLGLEAIVVPDGSRPSFLIKEGRIDERSGHLGMWEAVLGTDANDLEKTIACVGRINDPSLVYGYSGTGVLVAENLILTNRHVLQEIARIQGDNRWKLHDDTCIDFGHEYRGFTTLRRRKLKQVVFAGKDPIDPDNVDHRKLDVAAIELEPAATADRPRFVLDLRTAGQYPEGPAQVYTIGYPFRPQRGEYTPTLLDQLFDLLFGYKRLSPGEPIQSRREVAGWTLTHDATTLGGNSGSAVVQATKSFNIIALHYGGAREQPAENWGNLLGPALTETGAESDRFADVLRRFGVQIHQG